MKFVVITKEQSPSAAEQDIFTKVSTIVSETEPKPEVAIAPSPYKGLTPAAFPALAVEEPSIDFADVVAEDVDPTSLHGLIATICGPGESSKCSSGGCGSCSGCH